MSPMSDHSTVRYPIHPILRSSVSRTLRLALPPLRRHLVVDQRNMCFAEHGTSIIWVQTAFIKANLASSPVDIRTWFQNVEQHATEGVNKILIGNKCDWEDKRVVSQEQGQALADELGIPFLEVSAKSNINIDKAFYSLAADIKKRLVDYAKKDQPTGSSVNVGDKSDGGMGSKCC